MLLKDLDWTGIDKGHFDPYLLTVTHDAILMDDKTLRIHLDPNEEVVMDNDGRTKVQNSADADWLREQLKKAELGETVEVATKNSGLRLSSGAIGTILCTKDEKKHLALAQRSYHINVYQGWLDIFGGMSHAAPELLDPIGIAWRETAEELILLDQGVLKILQPPRNVPIKISKIVSEVLKRTEILGIDVQDIIMNKNYRVVQTGKELTVKTFLDDPRGLSGEATALVSWDPETSGIPLVLPIEIPVSSLDEITLFDGEEKGTSGELLNRDIALVSLEDKIIQGGKRPVRIFQNGRLSKEKIIECNFTPMAQTVLEALNKL